jgi:ceramide glucosyltransferase
MDAYANLATFCRQDYPEYQIIFGVRDEMDPNVAVVRQIINNFPSLDIQLVISDRIIGTNLKVSNLANMEPLAKYPLLLIADSDTRVKSDYLRQVVQPMADPTVGVVTCLYRSLAQGWVATLEAIGVSTDYHAGVLVARKLEGIKFALGQTILIRRGVLEAMGGFASIADYLADDLLLGRLPARLGYKVVLSNYVIEHVLPIQCFTGFIQRQTRWNRGTRVFRPLGYLGLIFTHGTVISLLFLLVTQGSSLGWVVFCATWTTRLAMAWIVGAQFLNDPIVKKFLWLVPLRDLIGFALWCYTFAGNSINWRGQQFLLSKEGKLLPLQTLSKKSELKPA